MRIIPAIDIIEGKCVRLSKGDYNTKKVYNENPLEVAKMFEGAGIAHLHLVDLDGAKSKHVVNYGILESIASKTNLNVDFGGGVKSDEDLKRVFNSGAKQVTGGSISVKEPDVFKRWVREHGGSKIILGADANNGKIATDGWLEESDKDATLFILDYLKDGVEYVISTDIAKDGMLMGPSFDFYSEVLNKVKEKNLNIKLIASGGVAEFDDIPKLKEIGCEGVIIGKAIYENRISLKELETFILNG